MRNYSRFDSYINDLQGDVYPNPPDPGHTKWAVETMDMIPDDVSTVLDVGCGEGFLQGYFEHKGIGWTGVTLGKDDYEKGKEQNRNIHLGDYSFLDILSKSYDLIFARHALEHSPFPIITLMEWHRISKKYLLLVAPAPEYWKYAGKNHYSVANEEQLQWWLNRSGWKINKREYLKTSDQSYMEFYMPKEKDRFKVIPPDPQVLVEYRYLCEKTEPITE